MHRRRRIVAAAVWVALVSGSVAAAAPGVDRGVLSGARLYVDPSSAAREQVRHWRLSRPADAAEMSKIAAQPQAAWFGDWNRDPANDVDSHVAEAAAAGAVPVLVAYDIPLRDCNSYSAGGAKSPAAYRAWIDGFARGIRGRPAVVVLEPDALGLLQCLSAQQQAVRLSLLRWAVQRLGAQRRTEVYLDAGNSAWHPASEMADRLRRAGVGGARGFALNVAGFGWTRDELAYGNTLSRALGGKHFVVDTSRNGRGPYPRSSWRSDQDGWCNPPGRALGQRPTTRTGDARADAFLWIKIPGTSDGPCNGGPRAGGWWPAYALGLARRARY
jgi:endoglucanase